jgi:hypothetical protein
VATTSKKTEQQLTYLLTPWSRVLLEKLTASAASQEIPRIFGTRRFLTVPTSARHLSLSWANSIQSPQPPPTSWRSEWTTTGWQKCAFLCHLLLSCEFIMLLCSIVLWQHIHFSCFFLPKTNDTQNNETYWCHNVLSLAVTQTAINAYNTTMRSHSLLLFYQNVCAFLFLYELE